MNALLAERKINRSTRRAKAIEEQHRPAKVKSRLSTNQQQWVFTALLSEKGMVNDNVENWLKLLKEEHEFVLSPSDLADGNGPLGALFYRVALDDKQKYAFEALPKLLVHFNKYGKSIPITHFHESKMNGYSLVDHIRAAAKTGITSPHDTLHSPLTRGLIR